MDAPFNLYLFCRDHPARRHSLFAVIDRSIFISVQPGIPACPYTKLWPGTNIYNFTNLA